MYLLIVIQSSCLGLAHVTESRQSTNQQLTLCHPLEQADFLRQSHDARSWNGDEEQMKPLKPEEVLLQQKQQLVEQQHRYERQHHMLQQQHQPVGTQTFHPGVQQHQPLPTQPLHPGAQQPTLSQETLLESHMQSNGWYYLCYLLILNYYIFKQIHFLLG